MERNGITITVDGNQVRIADEDGAVKVTEATAEAAARVAGLAYEAAGTAGLDAIDVRTRAVAAATTTYALAGVRSVAGAR